MPSSLFDEFFNMAFGELPAPRVRVSPAQVKLQSPKEMVVCLPTRGTIFTEVIQSVFQNALPFNAKFFFTSDKPIPDSFNTLFDAALKENPDLIWLVEDDVVVPPNGLNILLQTLEKKRADVVCAHYPLDSRYCHMILDSKGEFMYGGTGCVLIRSKSLLKLKMPYFSVDFDYIRDGDELRVKPAPKEKWAGQDVYFWRNCIESGLKVEVAELRCEQLRLVRRGKHRSNQGCHIIKRLK